MVLNNIAFNSAFASVNKELMIEIDEIINKYNLIQEKTDKIKLDYQLRFQDYYDANLTYSENLEYFKAVFPNYEDKHLLLFSKYILDKEFEDIKIILEEPEYGVDYLIELVEEEGILRNAKEIVNYIETNSINNKNDLNDVVNLFILPSYNSEIIEALMENNTGSSELSLKKAGSALKTLMSTSFNSPEFSSKVHKVIDNSRDHDVKLTSEEVPMQRYSTGKCTKVMFFKLPLSYENRNHLAQEFNSDKLENVYYIAGYGNFKDSGYSEPDFYRLFLNMTYSNQDELQNVVDATSNSKKYQELVTYIRASEEKVSNLVFGSQNDTKSSKISK